VNPNPITDVYKISSNVLGLGINGKVVECFDSAGEKYALKVSQKLPPSVKSNSYSSPVLTFPLLLIFLLPPSGQVERSCEAAVPTISIYPHCTLYTIYQWRKFNLTKLLNPHSKLKCKNVSTMQCTLFIYSKPTSPLEK
jgi:hypothetical protein